MQPHSPDPSFFNSQTGKQPVDKVGPYRISRFLGEGGMGRVYLAHHGVLDRATALKFMPEELVKTPGWVDRFCSEARTLAKLDHPHIVRVYGAEADVREGRCFLEIEYVDGGDLEERVQKSRPGLDEPFTRRVLQETLRALAYAHEKRVVHRDLKPANILLRKDGTVKISDFGLASVVGEDYHRSLIQKSITLSQLNKAETVQADTPSKLSAVGGTLPYMSPQAKAGEGPDPRDDIYAIGVMTYYLLTNKLPDYDTAPLRSLRPDVTAGWETFFRRCIAREREKRFQTAADALKALEAIGTPSRWPRLALVAAGLAAATAGVYFYLSLPPSGTTITRASQRIKFAGPTEPVSPDSKIELAATSTSGLPVTFKVVGGAGRIEDGFLHFAGPGQVVVRAVQEGNSRFLSSDPVEQTFEAVPLSTAPSPQKLTFPPIATRLHTDKAFIPEAVSSSGLPISFTVVSGPAVATESGIKPTGQTGVVVVRANQPGNAYFKPAESIEQRFTVDRAFTEELSLTLPGGVALKFALIPKGSVRLGPAEGETGSSINDSRKETYVVEQPYYLTSTEITQAQFRAITGSNPSYHNRSLPETHPVEQIRYDDLVRKGGFIDKCNAHLRATGVTEWIASLPTEQEWEYACRAGSETAFYDGSTLANAARDPALDRLAVYGDNKRPAAVGTREPNRWKLYDMLGNVSEWTAEGHLRGGSFRDAASSVRTSARLRDARNLKDEYGRFGFRIVLKLAAN